MKKNKKTIIIGMLIFLFVFLIYVVYYEINNIEVDYNTYYLNYTMNGGTKGTGSPSSTKYGSNVTIGNPTILFIPKFLLSVRFLS